MRMYNSKVNLSQGWGGTRKVLPKEVMRVSKIEGKRLDVRCENVILGKGNTGEQDRQGLALLDFIFLITFTLVRLH